LNYGATLVISVFEFGQAYTGTSGGNRVEVADIALLLEHVRAIPEPRSGVLGFIIVAIVLLFTRRELALDYCPNRRTTQAIRIAKLCSTCSGHFDRCEFLNSQTAPGWTSFSGLGTAQNAGGENDRQ
jgi:hypothetical protein